MNYLALNLKNYLAKNNMNQAGLATRSGLTRAAISQIINGKRDPSLSSIIKILNATGLPASCIHCEVKEISNVEAFGFLAESILTAIKKEANNE